VPTAYLAHEAGRHGRGYRNPRCGDGGGCKVIGHRASSSEGRGISFQNGVAMRVLVIHGPSLNLLGERQPEVYGNQSLAEVDAALLNEGEALGIDVRCAQRNGEAGIIELLHAARTEYDGVIVNPGAYAHYSYAIADAIASIDIPVVEVHLSNIAGRETHRRVSVTAAACAGSISGFGAESYLLALRCMLKLVKK
jgi:3-dehydroquinate dehydratase-2